MPIPPTLKAQISLNTVQPAFAINVDSWREWLNGVGVNFDDFGIPDRLDRMAVSTIVHERLANGLTSASNASGITCAYIAVNAWGYGDAGYGPHRVAEALAGGPQTGHRTVDSTVLDRLGEGAKLVLDPDYARASAETQGWKAGDFELDPSTYGYYYLNNDVGHVRGLGPAFFTKWLWAVSTQGDPETASALPILDKRVLTWMNANSDLELVDGRTPSYGKYVERIREWAREADTTPGRVEEAIFALTAR
ncbi:8-oxoguanine DNA glycosylase OGG fold protein [Demequina pelophila]|uniref:8-oxoguanine DNA glycosylase OGG fold protein n=1 Tax=Demequina pelophila TaxID=1638984 RepID=UPI0007836A58|nr:hypothetical protein [Demequina pelophila]